MQANGAFANQNVGLKVEWSVKLRGLKAQFGETDDPEVLLGASNFIAEAFVIATPLKKAQVEVGGGFINILLGDSKEIFYRPKHMGTGSKLLMKLNKVGPLWDPTPEAAKAGAFPYSTLVKTVPIDGAKHALYPFVDSPRFGFFKERDGQELLFTNGKTLYLIVLAFLINHDGDQDTEIVFQHKWLIDWRYRPHVHGMNSQGEPIVYQAEHEAAMEFINQLSGDRIANTEDISLIRTTWA